jgi:hypothetical protein
MATTETKTSVSKIEAPPPKPKRKPGPGRPPAAQAIQMREARSNAFFDAIGRVPTEDWGTRMILWLYRLEPYTDRRKSGDYIYLMQYLQPVDENRVMMDFGSGRYRLMLTSRKPGADRGDELDKYEFEIINQMHPPKIAPGEWIDDPRNIKWAWARPAAVPVNGQPQQPQQQSAVLETLQVLTHIEDRAAERAQANQPDKTDPIDAAVRILQLTKGGGDTVLMQMFASQLEHAQKRAEKLEDELRGRNNPAPVVAVDPFAQLKQMADGVKSLKDLGLFGGGESKENGSGGGVSRSRMGAWMEFFQPVLPEVAGILKAFATPLAGVMAQKMMQRPQATGQQQQVTPPNMAPPPQGIQQPTNSAPVVAAATAPPPNPDQQGLIDFIERITPPMLNHLSQGLSGEVFASFVADGWGTERVQQMQLAPPEAIIQFYKSTPYWAQLQDREKGFLQFLTEFAKWKPEEEDAPGDGDEEVEVG